MHHLFCRFFYHNYYSPFLLCTIVFNSTHEFYLFSNSHIPLVGSERTGVWCSAAYRVKPQHLDCDFLRHIHCLKELEFLYFKKTSKFINIALLDSCLNCALLLLTEPSHTALLSGFEWAHIFLLLYIDRISNSDICSLNLSALKLHLFYMQRTDL